MHKIIFTSDLHGNIIQYRKLIDYAIKSKAHAVIIGGDIAPKDSFIMRDIHGQGDFLKQLPNLLSPLKKAGCKVFLMLGNDDFGANVDIIENSDFLIYINEKRIKLTESFDIVGYSYVPITPFRLKDWEKFDLSFIPEKYMNDAAQRVFRPDGIKSTKQGLQEFYFKEDIQKKDSIQKDLEKELFQKKPDKTVYVFHSPPFGTSLDITGRDMHVGSIAVNLFIEKNQPYLTLHGHIHETVGMSGEFKQITGKTISISSGNDNESDELAVIVFELEEPGKAERIII